MQTFAPGQSLFSVGFTVSGSRRVVSVTFDRSVPTTATGFDCVIRSGGIAMFAKSSELFTTKADARRSDVGR